jgi:hypothetical protein
MKLPKGIPPVRLSGRASKPPSEPGLSVTIKPVSRAVGYHSRPKSLRMDTALYNVCRLVLLLVIPCMLDLYSLLSIILDLTFV